MIGVVPLVDLEELRQVAREEGQEDVPKGFIRVYLVAADIAKEAVAIDIEIPALADI